MMIKEIQAAVIDFRNMLLKHQGVLLRWALSMFDDKPITDDWLAQVCNITDTEDDCRLVYLFYAPGCHMGIVLYAERWQAYVYDDGNNSVTVAMNLKTRGQVRQLLSAFGTDPDDIG